jgi:sugar/nucleoside kinase (ribokinase family)
LMQAASDIFLGWQRVTEAGGNERHYYVRQLHDWRASVQPERMGPKGMNAFGQLCGWTLARAHARSGDRVAIAGYLGAKDRFEQAMVAFARTYADQGERDFEAMQAAAAEGRIEVVSGV